MSGGFHRVVRKPNASFGRAALNVQSVGGIVEAVFYDDKYEGEAQAFCDRCNTASANRGGPSASPVGGARAVMQAIANSTEKVHGPGSQEHRLIRSAAVDVAAMADAIERALLHLSAPEADAVRTELSNCLKRYRGVL